MNFQYKGGGKLITTPVFNSNFSFLLFELKLFDLEKFAKMLIILCTLLGIASCVDIEQALQSPRALLAQFNSYSVEFGKEYGTGKV